MKSIKPMLVLLTTTFMCFANAQTTRTITGKITDERGAVVTGATIKLCNSKKGVSTNTSGVYAIAIDANTKCFTVSGVGLQSQTISIKESNTIDVKTIAASTDLDELILIVPHHRYCRRGCPRGCGYYCSQKVVQKDSVKIIPKKVQQIFTKEAIKIYPNPATKNSIIHITIKDAGQYVLHFFDAQSRLLTVKNIIINTNNQTTEFPLPATVSSGNYFIRVNGQNVG